VRGAPPGPAQQHGQRDKPLLHAVMKIALDAAPFGVHRLDHARPGGGQLSDPAPEKFLLTGPEVAQRQGPLQGDHAEQPLTPGVQQQQSERDHRHQVEQIQETENQLAHPDGRAERPECQQGEHAAADQADQRPQRQVLQRALVLVVGRALDRQPARQPAAFGLGERPGPCPGPPDQDVEELGESQERAQRQADGQPAPASDHQIGSRRVISSESWCTVRHSYISITRS
jgi:hypothetical protein